MSSDVFNDIVNKRVSLDIGGMIYGATVTGFVDRDKVEERRIMFALRASRVDKLSLMFSDRALMLFEKTDGHFVVGYLRYRTKRVLDDENVTLIFAIERALIREVGRQGFRVRLRGACSFTQTIDAGDNVVTIETPASLVDISESGIGVVTKSPLHPNSKAECHIDIDDTPVLYKCKVVFCRPVGGADAVEPTFRCGLRFIDMTMAEQSALAKYIRVLQIKRIRAEFSES